MLKEQLRSYLSSHIIWEKYHSFFLKFCQTPNGLKSLSNFTEKFSTYITTDPNVEMGEDLYELIMDILLNKFDLLTQFFSHFSSYAAIATIVQQALQHLDKTDHDQQELQSKISTILSNYKQCPFLYTSENAAKFDSNLASASPIPFTTLSLPNLHDIFPHGLIFDFNTRLSLFHIFSTPTQPSSQQTSTKVGIRSYPFDLHDDGIYKDIEVVLCGAFYHLQTAFLSSILYSPLYSTAINHTCMLYTSVFHAHISPAIAPHLPSPPSPCPSYRGLTPTEIRSLASHHNIMEFVLEHTNILAVLNSMHSTFTTYSTSLQNAVHDTYLAHQSLQPKDDDVSMISLILFSFDTCCLWLLMSLFAHEQALTPSHSSAVLSATPQIVHLASCMQKIRSRQQPSLSSCTDLPINELTQCFGALIFFLTDPNRFFSQLQTLVSYLSLVLELNHAFLSNFPNIISCIQPALCPPHSQQSSHTSFTPTFTPTVFVSNVLSQLLQPYLSFFVLFHHPTLRLFLAHVGVTNAQHFFPDKLPTNSKELFQHMSFVNHAFSYSFYSFTGYTNLQPPATTVIHVNPRTLANNPEFKSSYSKIMQFLWPQ